MNLTEYKKKESDFVLVEKGESQVVLPPTTYFSGKAFFNIETTTLGTKIGYSFLEALPENAIIASTSIVVYGEFEGARRLVNGLDSISGSFLVDSKYKNPSLDVRIFFESDSRVFSIDENIVLDTTKNISISIKEPESVYNSTEDLIKELLKRIDRLSNRISVLEYKNQ